MIETDETGRRIKAAADEIEQKIIRRDFHAEFFDQSQDIAEIIVRHLIHGGTECPPNPLSPTS